MNGQLDLFVRKHILVYKINNDFKCEQEIVSTQCFFMFSISFESALLEYG